MTTIEFRECPEEVCHYYDKGPSSRRVIKAQKRLTYNRHTQKTNPAEYIVTHSWGRDTWRHEGSGYKMIKSTNAEELSQYAAYLRSY